MYTAIVFLPLLGALIAGLLGRVIGARASEVVTTVCLFVADRPAAHPYPELLHRTCRGKSRP